MNERSLTPNITVTIGHHTRSYFAFVTTAPTELDSPATVTQARLDEELRSLNQGTGRPQATTAFGTFVETQWQPLVLPTLKLSTQHGYKNVHRKHVLPYWRDWRLRDLGRLAGC